MSLKSYLLIKQKKPTKQFEYVIEKPKKKPTLYCNHCNIEYTTMNIGDKCAWCNRFLDQTRLKAKP